MKTLIRIVDDDPSQRAALRFLLEGSGYEVADYASAREFLTLDDRLIPGCVILDYQMPQMNGLELQEEKNKRGNDLPVIFLSAHGTLQRGIQAMKQGSVDFLEKPVEEEKLLQSISHALSQYLMRKQTGLTPEQAKKILSQLTPREAQVAELLAQGLLKGAVSERLGLGFKTVDSHTYSIYKKLNVHSSSELTELYSISRIVDLNQVP